jgi:hypothetical protein
MDAATAWQEAIFFATAPVQAITYQMANSRLQNSSTKLEQSKARNSIFAPSTISFEKRQRPDRTATLGILGR